ncbi:hypothetical protein RYX36_003403, partial [Vicia faba]
EIVGESITWKGFVERVSILEADNVVGEILNIVIHKVPIIAKWISCIEGKPGMR